MEICANCEKALNRGKFYRLPYVGTVCEECYKHATSPTDSKTDSKGADRDFHSVRHVFRQWQRIIDGE